MKTEKQKTEIEKKQTQVNGSPKFENGHLVSPVMNKDSKTTTADKEIKKTDTKKSNTKKTEPKKFDYDFAKFLSFIKKQDNLSVGDVSKSGNTKILLKKDNKTKIIWYAHEAKKYPVIIWNNLTKSTVHITKESDIVKLIATV